MISLLFWDFAKKWVVCVRGKKVVGLPRKKRRVFGGRFVRRAEKTPGPTDRLKNEKIYLGRMVPCVRGKKNLPCFGSVRDAGFPGRPFENLLRNAAKNPEKNDGLFTLDRRTPLGGKKRFS